MHPLRSTLLFALAAATSVAACSPGAEQGSGPALACPTGARFVGDRGAALAVVPGLGENGAFRALGAGDALPLVTPPQGGHVSFVAARLKNLDPCGVKLLARVRNLATGAVAAEDERTIDFAETDAEGFAVAPLDDIANYANVPMCPDYTARAIVDEPHSLEVRARDASGREASITIAVVPRCGQADDFERALCRCECAPDYVLGRCVDPLDGGWLDATARGSDAPGE